MDDFSWGRAIKHGAIAAAALLAVGIAIVATASGATDSYRLGQAIGRLLGWGFVAGVGFSFILQRRGRNLAIVVVTIATLVALGGLVGLRKTHDRALTSAESAPLLIDGAGAARRLRHPTLGYSVALPEDLVPLPASVAEAFRSEPGVTASAWGNPDTGRVMIVMLTTVHSRQNLVDFMGGVSDSEGSLATKAGVAKSAIQVKRNELSWSGDRGEAHRQVDIGDMHLRVDAFGSPYGKGRVLTVGVYTMSRGDDSFAELVGSFRAH